MKKKLESFLKKYKMASSDIDPFKTLSRFKEEATKGLMRTGPISECSIPMIATFLNPNASEKENEKVIVIDAGGTNLRVGLACFNKGAWQIDEISEEKMPGIEREYSKDEFFDYIAKMTIPYLDKAKNIGFCFSYRVEMNKDLDGKLLAWNKEIKAREVVGEYVGKSLLDAIKKYSNLDRKIVVLNDTTSVLLGGATLDKHHEFEKYVGAIYGTGFNCCYIEETKNIKKISGLDNELMIINTETGNFNGFSRGLFDEELTKESAYPLDALTEKMTSGKYLSTLIYKALKQAIKDGLISNKTVISASDDFSLPMVSESLVDDEVLKCNFESDEDLEFFKGICLELIERASKIVATTISAFSIMSNVDRIGIIIEGSTFYKLPTFKEKFEKYLKEILDEYRIEYKLFDGRGKILLGAAKAAMSK